MMTATVRSTDDIARLLGYRSPTGTGQMPRLVRDIAAADAATARHPAGTRPPLTLRCLREVRRRLMNADRAFAANAPRAGQQIDLTNRNQNARAFRRASAAGDIRELQPLLRALEARRSALGIPMFMSDLTAAKVDAAASDSIDSSSSGAASRVEQATLRAATLADILDPKTAVLVRNRGHLGIAGRNSYEWITTRKPTHEEMACAQSCCGKDPMGYGGPWDIEHHPIDGGRFKTVWTSSASCD